MTYAQLDNNNVVVGILESSSVPGAGGSLPPNMKDVTGRGVLMGQIYDSQADTFSDPPDPKAARLLLPIAAVKVYDPADQSMTLKTRFMVGDPIGIEVTVKDGQGNTVTQFVGTFDIPIMRWDYVKQAFAGVERRLALTFVAGVAQRTLANGFAQSGDYGVDDNISPYARVLQPFIVTVAE